MSMQITYGIQNGKEIIFDKADKGVNMTESLVNVAYGYFVENTYMEDDEEVTYRTIMVEKIPELVESLCKAEKNAFEEIAVARGAALIEEKIAQLKDYALFKSQILNMLMQKCEDKNKLLVLI